MERNLINEMDEMRGEHRTLQQANIQMHDRIARAEAQISAAAAGLKEMQEEAARMGRALDDTKRNGMQNAREIGSLATEMQHYVILEYPGGQIVMVPGEWREI